MKTFSQRKGLTPISDIIQKDSMTIELQNLLWNIIEIYLFRDEYNKYDDYSIKKFSISFWVYLRQPIDTIPYYHWDIIKEIRTIFFEYKWYEVYNLLEFINKYYIDNPKHLEFNCAVNLFLEKELSAYRIVDNIVTDITDEQEIQMLEEALNVNDKFSGVKIHLKRAFELYSDREKPDYRNSIKESISAVESICKIICNNEKASLQEALKIISNKNNLHNAFKDGLIKLYAYTSDAEGIRHSLLEEQNLSLTAGDAKYFLLSCTSFINYLKTKII